MFQLQEFQIKMIEHDELCSLIPHAGDMCLLDRVVEWDDTTIVCETSSHQDSDNPLRCEQGLSSVTGIEYGGQAMAVHGSLLGSAQTQEQTLYLAAVRDVQFEVNWIHDIEHPLTVRAERLMGDDNGMIYQFSILALSRLLVHGRLTVMMSAKEQAR
jgi:predicted hotdog family 3-hydroxylacyl-ACP dehydratase